MGGRRPGTLGSSGSSLPGEGQLPSAGQWPGQASGRGGGFEPTNHQILGASDPQTSWEWVEIPVSMPPEPRTSAGTAGRWSAGVAAHGLDSSALATSTARSSTGTSVASSSRGCVRNRDKGMDSEAMPAALAIRLLL